MFIELPKYGKSVKGTLKEEILSTDLSKYRNLKLLTMGRVNKHILITRVNR